MVTFAEKSGYPTAEPFLPDHFSLTRLREAAAKCKGCDLYRHAKQTVFGEGPRTAQVMLVGEQPGFQEDALGRPFVGASGKLLDKALEEAGIDRTKMYVTNVVKHYKWTSRNGRQANERASSAQIEACRPWLDSEIALLKPKVIVCLGSTAAQALLGKAFRVTHQRGKFIPSELAPHVLATVHPSSILRSPARHEETKKFVADLKQIAKVL